MMRVLNACKHGVEFCVRDVIYPIMKDVGRVLRAMLQPLLGFVFGGAAHGARNLHLKKHWLKRSGSTLWGNAIGLAIAMLSAQLISHFIEVRSVENLWGLFSERAVVSENAYRVVSFLVEFVVTLVVFSLVEMWMDRPKPPADPDEVEYD